MREISSGFRNRLEASSSAEVFLIFATITHPNLQQDIQVVNDLVDYTWGASIFIGFPFEVSLLTDTDSPPTATLRLQNIDRKIGQAVLTMVSSPSIQLDVLSSVDFSDVSNYVRADGSIGKMRTEIGAPLAEYSAPRLRLRNVRGDAMAVEGELWSWDLTQEPWPAVRATEDRLPGLYR